MDKLKDFYEVKCTLIFNAYIISLNLKQVIY